MPAAVSVPTRLLHESEGHKVTVELKTGDLYRGLVVDAEDNMNMQLQNVTHTAHDGRQAKLEHVYIRGSQIKLIILPDMLRHAPLLKRFDPKNKDAPKPVPPSIFMASTRGGRGGSGGGGFRGGRGRGR